MKKYLAAGAVAIMVFAFAAMAASLNVNAGLLQAGLDDSLTCTDNVTVDNYVVNTNGRLDGATVTAMSGEDCANQSVTIAFYDEGATGSGQQGILDGGQVTFDAQGVAVFESTLKDLPGDPDPGPAKARVDDIESVAVLIGDASAP